VSRPRLSVVLAVRDGAEYVAEAIGSILAQSFRDFELIVVDDGSADATPAILRGIDDPRLRVVTQPARGLTLALNRGVAESRADLVARLDADDVALPDRFARQLAALDADPALGVLGTGAEEIDAAGRVVGTVVPPLDDAAIRRALIRANPFIHSSVVFRRAAFEAAGGYDPAFPVAQDYDLWMRMSEVTRMANLAAPLVRRRLTPAMVSRARVGERRRAEVRIRLRALARGGYPPWCAIYLLRALAAAALPARASRLLGRGARA
jgi:glycosyltransferase involved in cell wall biosynthesis